MALIEIGEVPRDALKLAVEDGHLLGFAGRGCAELSAREGFLPVGADSLREGHHCQDAGDGSGAGALGKRSSTAGR